MRVLGIETSCDDTGVALYDSAMGLVAHKLHSQIQTHQPYGGTVPELASRDHIQNISPLVEQVLQAGHTTQPEIDGIAYTAGPGLKGALLVGSCFAKALAFAWQIPAIGIHHMEGHLLAALLEPVAPTYPFVALLVSGGHTLLVEAHGLGQYRVLGESLDDAAGEAFDKTAKLLGLAYPGGPAIQALAQTGDPTRFNFPRPLIRSLDLNFSFSGLKTATRRVIEKNALSEKDKSDVASSFQAAIVEVLVEKCKKALKQTGFKQLVVAGGVGANIVLREKLSELMRSLSGKLFCPRFEFCTDNGAMIAYAGCLRLQQKQQDPDLSIVPYSRWDLESL